MKISALLSALAATGLLIASPAMAHELHPDMSIGTTDRRENVGVHQFYWPTDNPVAPPVRSSAKARETIGGVVFHAATGAPIYAVADGTVVSAGPAGVVVHHGNGLRSTYSHIRYIKVAVGEKVRAPQLLGHVSPSQDWGRSHLYFQVHEGTRMVDPMDFLPAVDPDAE